MKLTSTIAITLTIMLAAFLAGCREEPVVVAEDDDPAEVLDSLEIKLAWVSYRFNMERWQSLTGQAADSLEFFDRLRRDLLDDSRTYGVLKDARSKLGDELYQRRLELLLPELVRANVDAQDITSGVADSLARFFETEWRRVDGRVTTKSDAKQAMIYARRRLDREAAYRGLSAPGELVAGQVGRLVRLRNQVARRLGYNDYLSLYARANQIDLNDYESLIQRVDSLTRPAYERLLSELRSGFGSNDFEVWDFANRFANTLTESDGYFPVDSQLVFARRAFDSLGFNLDKLPIYLNLDEAAGNSADLTIITVHPPDDVRIVGHLANGYESFRLLTEKLGVAVQASAVDQHEFLLTNLTEGGWDLTTSAVFERFFTRPSWLRGNTGMSPGTIERFHTALRALELLHLRLELVDALFEYEAYRSAAGDLNELYWELFERFLDLPAHRDVQPWAGKAELCNNPMAFYRRLAGEAAGAQTWHYLDQHYTESAASELGAFLRHNYFRFGTRYEWTDLVERATGQPLTTDYLAESFR